jgi:hypothetical protein
VVMMSAAMSRSLRLLCWLAATSNWKPVAAVMR